MIIDITMSDEIIGKSTKLKIKKSTFHKDKYNDILSKLKDNYNNLKLSNEQKEMVFSDIAKLCMVSIIINSISLAKLNNRMLKTLK